MSYRAREKPWHYIPVFDAIQNGGAQGLESATSFSTSTWRTVYSRIACVSRRWVSTWRRTVQAPPSLCGA